jgi:hypothetical protein
MQHSSNFWQFAKKEQTTFGAFVKGNKINLFNIIQKASIVFPKNLFRGG